MEYRKKSKKQNNSPLLYSISHDGRKVDEKDLISNFDSNNDGVLDVAELHVLSEQLTNQLQYNNTLIAQVQSLEQENFSLQQELHSQRELIRNVSKNYGESSNEVADLKSKLKTTQSIVENLSRQLRDCRLENDLLKRDAENAMETNVVSRTELENIKKELQSTKKQLADSDKAKNRVMEESRLHKSEADFKWSSLQTKNDALAKEVNFLKANILATEQEKKNLLTSSKEVTQAFNELKKQFDTEQFARQVSEKKINSISSNYDNIQKELVEKEVQLKDLHEKVDALTSKVRQQSVDRSDSEGRIRELEDALMDHQLSHKAFSEEKALMAKNEAKVKAEHANEMKKQRLELEKKLQALSEKYTESSRALNDLQRQSEESLTSAQQKLIETYKAKALAEESCKAMQTCLDEAALHCEGLKADHQLQWGECALQQNRAEETIAELQKQLHGTREAIDETQRNLTEEKDLAQAGAKWARQRLVERGEKSVETLGNIQKAVQALEEEAGESRERMREVTNQLILMRKRATALADSHNVTLETLRKELTITFKAMKVKNDCLKATNERLADQLRGEQLKKEEELGRNLLLEEQISRLEHEAAQTQKRLSMLEKEHSSIHQRHSNTVDQLTDDKVALEDKVAKMMRAHEDATARLHQAQEELRKHTSTLEEKNKLQIASKREMEVKLGQVTARLDQLQHEKEQETKLSIALARKVEQLELQLSEAGGERSAMVAQLERMRREQQEQLMQQQRALSTVGGATQQYHNQIKQTQELLKVVQTQKVELQSQNAALRNELNEFYNSAVVGSNIRRS